MPDSGTGADSQDGDGPERVGERLQRKVEEIAARHGPLPTTVPRLIDWSDGEGQYRLERELRAAGVPDLYQEATWDRVRGGDALNRYRQMLSGFVAQGRGLLLLGPVGTGKSSAAALVAKEAIMADLTVRWYYVPDLIDLLRGDARGDTLVKSSVADLLVWDDFGVGGLTDWQLGQLDRIVERRYSRRRPMVVTTNLTKEALLDDSMARMVDRWRERGFVVTISGESQRREWSDE